MKGTTSTMQTVKEYFESEIKRLTSQARDIAKAAEAETRGLSDEERVRVEGLVSEINELKGRVSSQEDNERLLDAIKNAGTVAEGKPSVAPESAKSVGEAFVRSEGYKGLIARGLTGAWTTGPVALGKAFGTKLDDGDGVPVVSEGTGGVFSPTSLVQPQVIPGVQTPIEQLPTIADLLGSGVAGSNTVVWLKEISTVNSAGLTSEGGLKPASDMDFDKVSTPLDKIATFLPISDEMMEDEPAVVTYINGRLVLFVRQAEDAYLLTGILGLAGTTSSAAELGGDNLFDAVAAAIMHVRRDAHLEPDALVISPADAARMDTARATGGTGAYFSGGPYGAPAANPWGLRRVVTTAVSDGSPIVGAFRQGATVWRRGGLSVAASNSHADYFRRNLTAVRAEERLALTIYRDDAFQVCSITS